MKKFVIITGVAVALLIILGFVAKFFVTQHKKSFSPEEEVTYNSGEVEIKVFYNRPFKKDREIFGGLVPFDKVWRTGANEATTFQTNKDLLIEGKTLKSGKYSLWTIPGEETWKVIFNSEYGQWGIGADGEANRNAAKDVLTVEVHAVQQERVFEQFTISFEKVGEEAEMVFIWDKTLVAVPFSY
ncbi:MAG TPA: DUF2911 domain-containing protein [Chryseolinea sp.]|jgi:hypothetical protein|nr:DUF2911 domain-containing protein [Chryseolinea sp.]